MKLVIMLSVILVASCNVDVEKYLERYGYYNTNSFDGKTLTESVKTFQRTFGLAATGIVGDETKKLMNTPRCGMADHHIAPLEDTKWNKTDLTYYYYNYTPDMPKSDLERLTERAFRYWSDETPLTFTEKKTGDIVIAFGSRAHRDDRKKCVYHFHGKGTTLAHAFLPPDGRLHFNEDELFTDRSTSGINYLWVATHEMGHVLGLEHDTKNKDAVMYPYYKAYVPNMKLHANDVYRIQKQYGKSTGGGPNTQAPKTVPPKSVPSTHPVTKPTQAGCFDQSVNCDDFKQRCNGDQKWINFMKTNCKKTCNFC